MTNSSQKPVYALEFLQNRRSVPAKMMTGPGPLPHQVKMLIEIASRVPDHKKLAPWRFVQYTKNHCVQMGAKFVLRTLELQNELKGEGDKKATSLSAEEIDLESSRLTRAGTVIAVISSPKEGTSVPIWEQQLSAGAACMNLLTGANAIGFDAQWLTEWYIYDETFRDDFGLRDGEQIAGIIHIGRKTAPKTGRSRPKFEDVFIVIGS